MSNFCFYFGDNQDLADKLRAQASLLWGELKQEVRSSFWLFTPSAESDDSPAQLSVVGAVSGYVRSNQVAASQPSSQHDLRFLSAIVDDENWPLNDDWTGNFGAVSYSTSERKVVICNDPIGYIPVYFATVGTDRVGGTSLLLLGRTLDSDVDTVGILQRISAPYCNYGRRTLLKQVARLLPGERMAFHYGRSKAVSTFDNQLCKGLVDTNVHEAARLVWDCLQRETDLATASEEEICVALSGGWDSRLALASVSHRTTKLNCYTFGNENLHEVRIAKRCADAVGANHRFFPIENTYFPSRDNFERLIERTETANQLQWCAVTGAIKSNAGAKPLILLGDLCESIGALNIKQFSTREARIKTFTNGLLGRSEQVMPATQEAFGEWEHRTRAQLLRTVLRNFNNLSPELASESDHQRLFEEISADLDLCVARVRDNAPAFQPMFDELFYWFHRARFLIAGQALILSSTFKPRCPAISMRFMRLISRLHPRLRLRRRLMNAIALLPEFDVLARIPSAQIPWLNARTPAVLREAVWGARSGIDQVLIRRALKNRNPSMRQRVLPTLDYMKEYQRKDSAPNVRSWFSGDWVKGDRYIDLVMRRASLASWPLSNTDIAAAANVSLFLDLSRSDTRQDQITVPFGHEVLFSNRSEEASKSSLSGEFR